MFEFLPIAEGQQRLISMISGNGFTFPPHRFLELLTSLLGTEIEAKSTQLCIVSADNHTDAKFFLASWEASSSIPSKLVAAWDQRNAADFVSHSQLIISCITSAAPGSIPVLVIGRDSRVSKVALLPEKFAASQFPLGMFAAVVRPKWSLDIRSRDLSCFQWIRLRDGSGFALRERSALIASITTASQAPVGSERAMASLVDLALNCSRCGIGAAVYVCDSRVAAERELRAKEVVAKRSGLMVPIAAATPQLLEYFMAFDGAVLGFFEGAALWIGDYGVYFHGPGGRRATARHVVRAAAGIRAAVVISQDGPLYLFSKGREDASDVDNVRFR